jgi:hypothetical protein
MRTTNFCPRRFDIGQPDSVLTAGGSGCGAAEQLPPCPAAGALTTRQHAYVGSVISTDFSRTLIWTVSAIVSGTGCWSI